MGKIARMKKLLRNKALLAVFLFTIALRVAYVLTIGNAPVTRADATTYDTLAMNIVNGNGLQLVGFFGKPWHSFRPPLFPYLLSAIYTVFGHNFLLARILQAVLSSLVCVIVYKIALKLSGSDAAGLLSASLTAVYPKFIYYSGFLMTETTYTFLLALSILALLMEAENPSWKNRFLAGVLLGLSTLTRSMIIGFVPLALLWRLLAPGNRIQSLKSSLGILLFFAATMTPWIIRNYHIHHRLVIVSTEGGYTFWLGHNPRATGGGECYYPEDPSEFEGLTEVETQELFYKKAFSYIREHPDRFWSMCREKITKFWRLYPHAEYVEWKYVVVGLFSFGLTLPFTVLGIVVSVRHRRKLALFYLLILYYTLIHTFFPAVTRYRVPITPYLLIFASFGIDWLLDAFRKQKAE